MIVLRVLFQTVGLALGQIRANKVRAALTALGIIIGVAATTSVIAALDGMKSSVLSEFETFGARKAWIFGQVPRPLRGKINWLDVQITPEEAAAIAEHAPAIDKITMIMDTRESVQYGVTVVQGVQVTGITAPWHEIEDRYVTLGRPFTSVDVENAAYTCLVNDKAITELLLETDPVGDHILVDGRRFLIIGVVETKKVSAMFGGETQAEVYIPYTTARKLNPQFGWSYAIAQLDDPEAAQDAEAQVTFVLRTMRGLKPGDLNTFEMEVLQQAIDQFKGISAGITAVAAGVVGISLLVGGIGIMNIMLVSVSERTREIGLRKAVGAKPAVILLQFLVEAVTLCLVGGAVGVVLGQVIVLGLQNIPGMGLEGASVPPWALGLAFGFCAVVGVVFGILPAIKAARLDPIVALRSE